MNNQVSEDCRETQSVFQMVKMWFQYRRNSNTGSSHWKRTSQDGTKKDQSSHEMEDTDKGQECRKLPRICQFLQKIYLKLQSYNKVFKWAKREKRVNMDLKILGGF